MKRGLEMMEIPRHIIFGPHALERIPKVLRRVRRGAEKIVVVSGIGPTFKIASESITPVLQAESYTVSHHRVPSRLTVKSIVDLSNQVTRTDAEAVLAVGGGRVQDAAKVSASWCQTPYLSVPTSAANDGISSPAISYLLRMGIKNDLGDGKAEVNAPVGIVADTEIIAKAPQETLVSGCGDLMAKFTAVLDWELAHRLRGESYSEYAASISLLSAELIVKHAEYLRTGLEPSVRTVVKALIGSGVAMSIAGSSRPASGSEHLFSHSLDLLSKKHGFRHAAHGLQVGVGSIMMMWLHGGDWKKIRDTLRETGAPTTARELGVPSEMVLKALTMSHEIRPERYTILGDTGLTPGAAKRMAEETGVL